MFVAQALQIAPGNLRTNPCADPSPGCPGHPPLPGPFHRHVRKYIRDNEAEREGLKDLLKEKDGQLGEAQVRAMNMCA